jgi:hypothetical protein
MCGVLDDMWKRRGFAILLLYITGYVLLLLLAG